MSQKAICPRGHIWDPSTLAGLPPTGTPRCPICGEEEPLRTRNALTRLNRWGRNNTGLAGLTIVCFLLAVALAVAIIQAQKRMQMMREEAEKARFDTQQAEAKLLSRRRGVDTAEETQRQERQAEMQAAKWRNREKEFQAELLEAKKARRDALRQRDEQFAQRRLAEELAQTADQVRQEALRRRAETTRQLVKMYVAAGTRLMESGDLSTSLLWLVEALRLAEKEKLPQETHRLRLAAVLAQCPRPVQMWLHDKTLNAVRLSSDGKRVLTAGANGAAEVWDMATGKRIGEVLPHAEAVTHAAIRSDGKRVLTADADKMLHLWDVEMGEEVFTAQQLQGPVVGLAFSADGKRFLTVTDKAPMGEMGATEVELHVRDAASGEAIREQALGSEISPRPAVFSPDGQRVLTICQDRCARVWDIATGKQIGSSFAHAAAVVQASFSPDGERVLTASADGTARVWRTKTGEPVTPPLKHGATVQGACFSPAGLHVLTFAEDRGVRVWDASNGEAVGPALRHVEAVSDAVFSPDGRYVLTTSTDGAARVWDYRTGEEVLAALRHGEPIRYAVFTLAGEGLLTLAGQVVRMWDLTAGESPMPPRVRSETGLAVFSSDGKRVLRATETAVRVYDTKTNQPVGGTLPHKNKVTAAAFSADGRRVLTVSHQPNGDEMEGHVRVWETATGQLLGEPLVHPRSVLEARFHPDGRRVLTACQDGKARLWDVEKSSLVGEPMVHEKDLNRALFVPDGKRLLTVDVEGGIRLWDADKAEAVGPTWGHRKPVNHLAFSANGQRLVTASDDGTARVWEASTGHEIAMTAVQSVPVMQAAFSPDGKRIVTVGSDRWARVWDAGNGKLVGPPLRHCAAVALAVFSADGKRIVTAAADGLRIWDAASGEPLGPRMRCRQDIHGVALGRDGRLVLSCGTPGDPSARVSSDFRADERPAADLLRIAEVLSAARTADAGEMAPLDRAELSKAWQDVRKKQGKDFTPTAERAAAWHQRGAEECESRHFWIGVLQHLDYLITSRASADLYARRGRANLELRRWETAKADYTKALAGDGERWDLWAGRAEVEAALGRWQEAAADYSRAIERRSDGAELWAARGRVEAEQGDWRKAADDLGKAIHLGDQDVTTWCQHILALLAGGDEANYRRWCERLVQRFGAGKDKTAVRRIVWTCALLEGAVRDWKPLLQRSARAAAANPQSADSLRQLAVLLYRAGQFETALAKLQDLTKLHGQQAEARDWLLLAMTAQRLGRAEQAKTWFDKAEQVRAKSKDDKESWEDRLVYQTLHREAEMLIKGGKR